MGRVHKQVSQKPNQHLAYFFILEWGYWNPNIYEELELHGSINMQIL